MAFRITLECGDSSCLRTKKTHEGYTHDWEVFVRGVDNAAIHHYIEKVVFNLHETFPKPKRVIKEPPYSLKESGYAGFDIPIHIYLKNKNEPKRLEIMYNLNLETSGPTISHITHHNDIIVNPTDEFRKKLLKGGAMPISSMESTSEKNEVKTLPMVGKPKLSGNEGRKHRISEPKISNPFNDLFGIPIKTAKISQDNKKTSDKSSSVKSITVPEKFDKTDKITKVKHSPYKESKKEKSEERKEKRDKDKDTTKEKEKIKEKSKRSSSPSSKTSHQSSESRRPTSPSPMKKPATPPPIIKRSSSPSSKLKEKDSKKIVELEKDKEKSKESSKANSEENKSEKNEKESKSERKKDKKKHKEDRDKEKKEKYKDKERDKGRDKDSTKSVEKKIEKSEKIEKDKLYETKHSKDDRKSPKPSKEPSNEKIKEEKISKSDKSEKNEKSEKQKDSKSEKSDKQKHKHKKKDKKDKRDGSKEREKKEKREKSKSSSEKQSEVANQTSSTLVTSRVTEVQERESSDSIASAEEDTIMESRIATSISKELTPLGPPTEVIRAMSPPPPPVSDIKKDKSERKRDRSKTTREDRESKKKKRKSENKVFGDEEIVNKNKDRDHSSSPLVEPVSSSQSPIATTIGSVHISKVKHTDGQIVNEPATGDSEQVAPDSTNSTLVDTEEPLIFSEDYVSQLKDLQRKIMTLQDNQELQRVVQVIAETGHYEITKKTFDFDLCALDRRTVQRLQQFFAS